MTPATLTPVALTPAALAGEHARRRRVRRSALAWCLVAAGFYVGFIVLILARGAR